MAKIKFPRATAVVLDSDRKLGHLVARRLRLTLPNAKVLAFSERTAAWQRLRRQRALEPYVFVTDTIGVLPRANSFVQKVASSYPRSSIVLFSGRVSLEQVVNLQNDKRIIDRYVNKEDKDSVNRVVQIAQECFGLYEQDTVLDSLRQYLAQCRYPRAPFTQIGSKDYSLVDIYWEIVIKSDVGDVMERVWRSLLVKAALLEETGVEK